MLGVRVRVISATLLLECGVREEVVSVSVTEKQNRAQEKVVSAVVV
jgi:hypothetical protein